MCKGMNFCLAEELNVFEQNQWHLWLLLPEQGHLYKSQQNWLVMKDGVEKMIQWGSVLLDTSYITNSV